MCSDYVDFNKEVAPSGNLAPYSPLAPAGLPAVDSELQILLYWIREREAVRKAKVAGLPKPWTQDRLLQSYRWCNVSRMDDKVSLELMAGWYDRNASPLTLLVASVLGRLVNWPESLLDATDGSPFRMEHLSRVRRLLKARGERGEKVFTGAYVVPGVPGKNKVDSTLDLAEFVSIKATDILKNSLRETWTRLIALDGLGGFLAGQMTADLAYLSAGESWPDRFSWAPVGPGSARGLNRLLGKQKNRAVKQAQFDHELSAYIALLKPMIPVIHEDRRLGAQDYQSTLCEFDKYRRLQLGEGSVRATYDGLGSVQARLL